MKIITIARTLNEERNIERFCNSYQNISDMILVADGGSTDNTIEIAKSFPNVQVREYTEKIELENGLWRNPDWKHINFLIEWAENEGADWIMLDDCDTTPNYLLQQDGRNALLETDLSFVMTVSLFLWGEDMHFPRLSRAGIHAVGHMDWYAGIWAWRTNQEIRVYGDPPHFMFERKSKPGIMVNFDTEDGLKLMPPYCRLHRNSPTPEIAQERQDYYKQSGLIPEMLHPMAIGGALEKLPEWARDNE